MKLSVIIVNYNVRPYLTACLDSVQRALEGIESEVFVVDNHSDDDSVEVISRDYAWVHLINNRENLGFSKANNIAIRQAQGEYILLLNPDTVVAEETLKGVIDFMDQHPKAGGAGVRMHNADGTLAPESRRAIPTPFVAARKMLGFTKRYYMSYLSWDSPAQIEVVSGAFMLLRHKAIYEVGMLDEDFFILMPNGTDKGCVEVGHSLQYIEVIKSLQATATASYQCNCSESNGINLFK